MPRISPLPAGERYPHGRPKAVRQRDGGTPELLLRRADHNGEANMHVGIDHPLDLMWARGELHRDPARTDAEDAVIRRDIGAQYARLHWSVFGQPSASVDGRYRKLVKAEPSADDTKGRPAIPLSPDERAEADALRIEAQRRVLGRGTIREWTINQVCVYRVPMADLARSPSRRVRLHRHLLDALDALADEGAVRRAMDAIEAERRGKREDAV